MVASILTHLLPAAATEAFAQRVRRAAWTALPFTLRMTPEELLVVTAGIRFASSATSTRIAALLRANGGKERGARHLSSAPPA